MFDWLKNWKETFKEKQDFKKWWFEEFAETNEEKFGACKNFHWKNTYLIYKQQEQIDFLQEEINECKRCLRYSFENREELNNLIENINKINEKFENITKQKIQDDV